MTPHLNTKQGDFPATVFMPGDPLRAKFIAENFFEGAQQISNVRNILGFKGKFKGKKVAVLAHGMGIPSCLIYASELIKFYGVKNLIRIGSCGAIAEDLQLGQVILANSACTDSNVNRIRFDGYDFAAVADFGLMQKAYQSAKEQNIAVKVGAIFSTDLFYHPYHEKWLNLMSRYNILAVEMEAAGIYGLAAEMNAKALTVLTVSDHLKTGEAMSPEQREASFHDMVKIALPIAIE